MRHILIVEDQLSIRKMLQLNLGVAGYQVTAAADGRQAVSLLESEADYDLALVDVMLPGLDGFQLLPYFHARDIPVIFLTARGDLESKVRGLTGGAEDYVVKPFEMLELQIRMEKVLARRGRQEVTIRLGDILIDTEHRTVRREGAPLQLTKMEYELLILFVQNRNMALSREQLLNQVWGICYAGGTRTVDVHVAQLRKKTGLPIVSVPKVGYRLEVPT